MSGFRSATILSPLALAGILVALGHLDEARQGAPVLGLLRGPLGWLLLLLAALIVAARVIPWRIPPPVPALLGPLPRFVLGAALVAGLGLSYSGRLRVSGDEPHYLLMAQSLWRDGDLDLQNNFANEDYREYTPGPVRPHYGAPRRDGRPYPAHSPGLPVLLAPIYALAGRAGCVVFLALCAAAVAARTSVFTQRWGSPAGGLWAFGAALGPPLLFYGFHVYTEAPSALATIVALELLLVAAPTVPLALLAAAAASLLPWLHVKMTLVAAALGVVGLVRLRGRPRAAFLGLSAVLGAAYLLYFQAIFGSPTPLALYGGGVPSDVSLSPLRALSGLGLDRSFGLLPHAPLFVLALPGLAAVAARWRATWPVLLVLGAILVPALAWRMWWGGQCPPGRFLVPLVPILALGVGLVAGGARRGLAHWRWPLAAWGFGLALFMAADPGALLLLNRANRPTRVWGALSGEVTLGRYLPSLTLADPVEARVAILWVAAMGALLVLHSLAQRRDQVDRHFRGLALPVAMLLGIGLAVDGWARAGQPASPAGPPASIEEVSG